MAPLSILFVALSTVSHAYWNFLLKRARGTHAFLALSKMVEVALGLPVAAVLVIQSPPPLLSYWWLIVGAALGTALYYVLLIRAYRLGNLTLVYPVTRAGSLAFLPLLAFIALGEHIDWLGIAAIGLIIAAIFILQLEKLDRGSVAALAAGSSQPAVRVALAAAFLAASTSLWDKYAVQFLPVFVYYYIYTALTAAGYCLVLIVRSPRQVLRPEFRRNRWAIVQVGFLTMSSYVLVLFALQAGKASYVIALRQMSIGFGALMGRFWLGEPFEGHRWLGLALLLVGCLLVSLAK